MTTILMTLTSALTCAFCLYTGYYFLAAFNAIVALWGIGIIKKGYKRGKSPK